MVYIWREGFLVGKVGMEERIFSGVGRYSLVKTYAMSYNSFCNLRYQINA